MKKLLFVLAVIASLFAAGCKKSYHLESYENEWFLINIEQNGVNVSPYLMGVEATLTGEKVSSNTLKITGCSGINQYFGEIKFKGDKISVGDKMGSTKMAGAPEAMEFEDLFLKGLTGADKIYLEATGEAVILKIENTKDNITLIFS